MILPPFLLLAKEGHEKLITCSTQGVNNMLRKILTWNNHCFFLYALCCYPVLITNFRKMLIATFRPKLDMRENKHKFIKNVMTQQNFTELTMCWNHSYPVTHYCIWWPFPWHFNIMFIYNCKIQVWRWIYCKRFIPGVCLKVWTRFRKWINKIKSSKAY